MGQNLNPFCSECFSWEIKVFKNITELTTLSQIAIYASNIHCICTCTCMCRCLLFVCLFVWSFSSHSTFFHSYGDVTISGEGQQLFIYARHSWPLSSDGSLQLWHGASVYNGHLNGPVTLTLIAEVLAVGLSLPFFRLGLAVLGFEHPTFRMRG